MTPPQVSACSRCSRFSKTLSWRHTSSPWLLLLLLNSPPMVPWSPGHTLVTHWSHPVSGHTLSVVTHWRGHTECGPLLCYGRPWRHQATLPLAASPCWCCHHRPPTRHSDTRPAARSSEPGGQCQWICGHYFYCLLTS